jgi:hypothetical protein
MKMKTEMKGSANWRREYMRGYADACDEMMRRAYHHGWRDGHDEGFGCGLNYAWDKAEDTKVEVGFREKLSDQ